MICARLGALIEDDGQEEARRRGRSGTGGDGGADGNTLQKISILTSHLVPNISSS